MNNETNTRMAYIARDPDRPGALGYINADTAHIPKARAVMQSWLESGALVQKVPLDQAISELNRYAATIIAKQIKSQGEVK